MGIQSSAPVAARDTWFSEIREKERVNPAGVPCRRSLRGSCWLCGGCVLDDTVCPVLITRALVFTSLPGQGTRVPAPASILIFFIFVLRNRENIPIIPMHAKGGAQDC